MNSKLKFVAHRGESEAAPENTLEAFTLAWLRGARCIEGDFHLSRDGGIICMHDDNAARTCGVNRPLAAMTLEEIKSLDAGSWKSEAWRFTRVPTLAEVLRTMPPYGEIFIELKSVGPILDKLQAVFDSSGRKAEQLTFIAFDEETISTVKKRFPAHKAYWLTGNSKSTGENSSEPEFTPDELVRKLQTLGVDGVDVHDKYVTKEQVDALHAAGLSFNVWTVDSPERARYLIECGVDSITTNSCYALRNELLAEGK